MKLVALPEPFSNTALKLILIMCRQFCRAASFLCGACSGNSLYIKKCIHFNVAPTTHSIPDWALQMPYIHGPNEYVTTNQICVADLRYYDHCQKI
jgi:hypothetical protein